MRGEIEFTWPAFRLVFVPASGYTVTTFPDGTTSGCLPVPDDDYHANRLGITNKIHRFEHELIHHLVALWFGHDYSPVIWRDAHSEPHPEEEAKNEERLITSFQYHLHLQLDIYNDWAPLDALMAKVDLAKARKEALLYLRAVQTELQAPTPTIRWRPV